MSFPLHVKRIIFLFVYLNNHNPSIVYPSFEQEELSPFIVDRDPILSSESYKKDDVHIQIPSELDQSYKHVYNKVDLPSPIIIVVPCN